MLLPLVSSTRRTKVGQKFLLCNTLGQILLKKLVKIMTDFANFLFINGIKRKEIAEFLGVPNSFITRICSGEKKLPERQRIKIYNSGKGWDCSMLDSHIVQTIGDHSHNNTQVAGEQESLKRENELLKQLLEEKERTIQILLNK